jgi:hypothetical protein
MQINTLNTNKQSCVILAPSEKRFQRGYLHCVGFWVFIGYLCLQKCHIIRSLRIQKKPALTLIQLLIKRKCQYIQNVLTKFM